MTYWISVGAARIQTWIGATPQLTYMRGASTALHQETLPAVIDAWRAKQPLLEQVSLQTAESSVDGVVVMTAPDAPTARTAAVRLLDYLGERLPGLQWEGWWVDADTFLGAFDTAVGTGANPRVGRITSLPPLQDNGIVKACLICRREPGGLPENGSLDTPGDIAEFVPDSKDARNVRTQGADCAARARYARFPERAELRGTRHAVDFQELARLGGLSDEAAGAAIGRRASRNHLATIVADGNGMGALFSTIAQSSLTLDRLHQEAVKALNDAAHQSVLDADDTIGSPAARIQATFPHFVGGDDILVSVPACEAWRFAVTLATAFASFLSTSLAALLDSDVPDRLAPGRQELVEAISRISLGVGITFAHETHPFAETSAKAHQAMRAAKELGKGGRAAIGWRDLTAETDPVLSKTFVIEAAPVRQQLNSTQAHSGVALFGVSASGRAQLGSILRDVPAPARPQCIRDWRARQRGLRSDDLPRDEADLRADLARARWWPGAAVSDDDQGGDGSTL